MFRRTAVFVPTLLALTVLVPLTARADEKKLGWADVAELGFLATSGNAESQSLSFRNLLSHTWNEALFSLEATGIRAESTTVSRSAVGTPAQPVILEVSDTQLTAEAYQLRGRYDRQVSEHLFWFGGAGWEQNEFAGIDTRTSLVAGVGRIFFEGEDAKFRADVGATWTREEPLARGFGRSVKATDFGGLRGSWDYSRKLSATTTYANGLVVDANLDETDDYRADMINSLAVAMTERLALKVAVQLLYDHQPALIAIPLSNPDGSLSQTPVLVPLDDLDTRVTVALVVNF